MPRVTPTIGTASPGQFETAAFWNANVAALGNFTLGPPVFSAYQSAVQSLGNNLHVPISLDTEVLDSEGGHSTLTNTSRYVCQVAGTYAILGAGAFGANATGIRVAALYISGSIIRGSQMISPPNGSTQMSVVTFAVSPMAVGDYLELNVQQTTGAALNTYFGVDTTSCLDVFWISQ